MVALASSSNHDPDFLPRIDRVAALAAISPDTPQVRWIAGSRCRLCRPAYMIASRIASAAKVMSKTGKVITTPTLK